MTSTEQSTDAIYCYGCANSVKAIDSHTLPRNVISKGSGTFLKENTRPEFQRLRHKTDVLLATIEQFSSRESDTMEPRQKAALDFFEEWRGPINVK
ncbi:MAG: hypothetical protein Q9187_009440, partial [Circinaria calcarea]